VALPDAHALLSLGRRGCIIPDGPPSQGRLHKPRLDRSGLGGCQRHRSRQRAPRG
jgi:hypothetical protein